MSEASKILQRRDIQRYLARPYRIEWGPLWLTGGSSADGAIIFLDSNLRNRPKYAARVIYHERVEAAVRHCLGWGYVEAHRVATEAETDKFGSEPKEYRQIVNANLKRPTRYLPRQFDKRLAREAAESIGQP